MKLKRTILALLLAFLWIKGSALEIHLPPELGAFKQGTAAELANGQCLVCHSVEYVSTQPPMPRSFWKAEVQKMQQKYGAAIPDEQVDALIDYFTSNYGVGTNAVSFAGTGTAAVASNGSSATLLATKYGCLGCHNPVTKIVGPSYRDIAAKYRNDPEALQKIDQQIHQGGSGKWGPVIMPPFPSISAQETRILADWILGTQ